MIKYTHEKFNDHITLINALGTYLYLIEGTERGVLIDTGSGIGDLKSYVDKLATKPYDVLITHCHFDHILGNGLFDKVYLHPEDWYGYRTNYDVDAVLAFLRSYGSKMIDEAMKDFTYADVNCYRENFLPMEDGVVFDLGGLHVRGIHVKGHTHGCMTFLIEEDRILFVGDAVTKHTLLLMDEALSVEEYLEGLMHLKEFDGQYDTVIRSHNTVTAPLELIDDNIELCQLVLEEKDAHQPIFNHGKHGFAAAFMDENEVRLDGKLCNIYYKTRYKE